MSIKDLAATVLAVKTQIEVKASTATAEELAYLSTALEKIVAAAAIVDIEALGETKKAELVAVSVAEVQKILAEAASAGAAEVEKIQTALSAALASTSLGALRDVKLNSPQPGETLVFDEHGVLANAKQSGAASQAGLELKDSAVLNFSMGSDYRDSAALYRCLMKTDDSQFGVCAGVKGVNRCAFLIAPFSVDVAGNISVSSPQPIWENSSGGSISTTYFVHQPGSQKILAAGNNGYPGESVNKYGYFFAQLENGVVSNQGYMIDNWSCRGNGVSGGFFDSDGDGFYATYAGISPGDGKARLNRLDYSGSQPSVITVNPDSYSATSYPVALIGQQGIQNPVISGLHYFYGAAANQRYLRVFSSAGASKDYPVLTLESDSIAFALSSGKVLLVSRDGLSLFNAYNSRATVQSRWPFHFSLSMSAKVSCVGVDRWLIYDYPARSLVLVKIDPQSGVVSEIERYDMSGINIPYAFLDYCRLQTAGANHEYIVIVTGMNGVKQPVYVYNNPIDVTQSA